MSLAQCDTYLIDGQLLQVAEAIMRRAGAQGCEAGFFLAGSVRGNICTIDTLCIPHQYAYSVEEGCALTIPGTEVTRLGHLVEAQGRQFCGQLHSHPGRAFHSHPDATAPAMRFAGAISIVTPRFAVEGVLPRQAAVFRFDLQKPGWVPLISRWRARSIRIIDTPDFQVVGLD